MKPIISIIVPVYNVEKYLHKCVDSILEQTFKDFELILINDGSTDNCGDICESYSKFDNRIKVFHQKNQGVSSSRNKGIIESKGKYIMFLDSDDYVASNYCEVLIDAIEHKNHSLIISSFYIHRLDTGEILKVGYGEKETNYKVDKAEFYSVYEKNLLNFSWNKIYKTNIIKDNNISFIENIQLGEDLLFNLEYLKYVDGEIIIVNKYLYNYILKSRDSLVRRYHKNLFETCKYSYSELYNCMLLFGTDMLEKNQSYYSSYLNYLHTVLDNTFKNSELSFIKKIRYNNMIIKTEEFKKALQNADKLEFNKRFLALYKLENYFIIYLFKKIIIVKNKFLQLRIKRTYNG